MNRHNLAMTALRRFHYALVAATLVAVLGCNFIREPDAESGLPISATPIRLVIPAGLATGASAETIDIITDQTGPAWDVAPAHMQLTFQAYALQTTFHVPQLFVYPAQQYVALNPSAAESIRRLQSILANPSALQNNDGLPHVPFFNAGQVFAAQQKVIHFSGGSGVRFITQYGQDVSPINNSGLFYHFQGLSDDGTTYVVGILPVNLPMLAADNNPNSPVPPGGIPFPAPSASPSDIKDYYSQLAARINAAPAGRFSPSLDTLDQMMGSMIVGP